MIDIHNHILPAVDDGARDAETSLAMLREAIDQGVEQIVLTPHLYEADIVIQTSDWQEKIDKASKVVFDLVEKHKLPIKVVVAADAVVNASAVKKLLLATANKFFYFLN